PGHKDHRQIGTERPQALDEHTATHARHDDVGHDDIDVALVLAAIERLDAVDRLDYRVAFRGQHAGRIASDRLFILHDQYALAVRRFWSARHGLLHLGCAVLAHR